MVQYNMKEKILQLLKKHNYLVKLQLTDDGCIASFPSKKNGVNIDEQSVLYEYEEPELIITGTSGSTKIHVDNYAYKNIIIFHVILLCSEIDYNANMILFYNKDGKEIDEQTFVDSLSPVVINTQKEELLRVALFKGLATRFDKEIDSYAQENGVYEPYAIVKKMYIGDTNE